MAKSKNLCLLSGASSKAILQTGEESQHGLERLHVVPLRAMISAMYEHVRVFGRGKLKFSLEATADGAFYRRVRDEPLKVHGSLYLTLFDNPQTACVPFGDRSVRVQRVSVCSASAGANRQSYFLICSSAFRFPPVLVSYHFIESAKETVQDVGSSTEPRRAISYSPFPAELGTSPVSQDFTFSTATVPLSEAEVDTVGPLTHIRRNLEIDNLRLSDFEVRPAAVSPYQVGLGKTVSALTSTDAPGRSLSTRWVSTPLPFRYPYFSRTRFKEIFAVSFPPSPPRLTCL